jgi:hypothetical protein
MTDRPAWAYAFYARRTVRALCLFAEAPRSASRLAQDLQVAPAAARRLIAMLTEDGLIEEHPDTHRRHRLYRMAAGGHELGLLLVLSGLRELDRREDEYRSLSLGQALARYRRARGLSQPEFAARVDLDVLDGQTWGQIELGHVDLLDVLARRRGSTPSTGERSDGSRSTD